MAIKPIDLQVNIGQMHDVAKSEQARASAASEVQSSLAGEAGQKSRLVPTRIEENKKAEHAIITNEEKAEGRRKGGKRKRNGKETGQETGEGLRDERMGLFIDVRK
jgi:hypothetical protein